MSDVTANSPSAGSSTGAGRSTWPCSRSRWPTARSPSARSSCTAGAVALVPMVDADHVCLVENHRYAVGKTLLEVPAGTIDPGESPDADRRARARRGDRLPRRADRPASASGSSRPAC